MRYIAMYTQARFEREVADLHDDGARGGLLSSASRRMITRSKARVKPVWRECRSAKSEPHSSEGP